MKKLILPIGIAALLAVAACGKKEENAPEQITPQGSALQQAPSPATPATPAQPTPDTTTPTDQPAPADQPQQ